LGLVTPPGPVTVVAAVVLFVLVLAIRRPVRRRLRAGTAWDEWRATAEQLPWRDRWSVYVANSLGRAASPRLAALAVRRGEVVATIALHAAERRRALRKVLYAAGVLAVAALAVDVAAYFAEGDGGPSFWILVPCTVLTVALAVGSEPFHRREVGLVRRSVERSRELTR
jgi:hypothetical protein